jgi:hypothetical protein
LFRDLIKVFDREIAMLEAELGHELADARRPLGGCSAPAGQPAVG